VPGPAAYGLGGDQPTVTDANVVLGRLDPNDFLGGSMALDAKASEAVIARLAGQLGLSLNETAEGVLTIINSNMANAIRSRTVQKGIDPRGFALVAFGGAGPLHGAEVAAMLGIPEIIVPPFPGITSAMGLLTTDLKYDAIRTQFQVSGAVDLARLNADCRAMEAQLSAQFEADRIPAENVSFQRVGDLRYVGQGYELKIPMPSGEIAEKDLGSVWAAFHKAHAAEYGHAFEASPIEIVNVRVSGIGVMPKITRLKPPPGGSLADALVRRNACVFRVKGELESFDTPIYRRELLPVGTPFKGPAIILQKDSTTVVPPGATADVHRSGSILISLGEAQ
jgi:N-methylhydantoinase A